MTQSVWFQRCSVCVLVNFPLFSSHHFSFSSFIYLKEQHFLILWHSFHQLYFFIFLRSSFFPLSLVALSCRPLSAVCLSCSLFPCTIVSIAPASLSRCSVADAFLNQLPVAGVCNDHGKTYALYTLTVIRKNSDGSEDIWKTYRRYSDFHDFHMRITEQVRQVCPLMNITRQLSDRFVYCL